MLQHFRSLLGDRIVITVVSGGLALGAWHEFMGGVATVPNTNAAFSDAKIKGAQAEVASAETRARSCKERLDAYAKGMVIPNELLSSMTAPGASYNPDVVMQKMVAANPMDDQLARDCSPGYAERQDTCSASLHDLMKTFTPAMPWDDMKAKLEAHKQTGCAFSKADADFIQADIEAKSAACLNQSKAFYASMPNERAKATSALAKVDAFMKEHGKTCAMGRTEAELYKGWAVSSLGVDPAAFDKVIKEADAKTSTAKR